jgi:hypothetical protein
MKSINELIEKVERRYNPEYDIPSGPIVTITDMQLLECIKLLQRRIDALEQQEQTDHAWWK